MRIVLRFSNQLKLYGQKRKKNLNFLISFCLFQLVFYQSIAFQTDTIIKKKSGFKTKVFPVPTLGSAPETGFYFGAVALFDFIPRNDSLPRHSVAKTELSYTLKKQFIVALDWTLTDKNRNWIFQGDNSWLRFPELFWGKGGNTPKSNGVLYDATRIELANGLYRKVENAWYVGLCQQFQQINRRSFNDFSGKTPPIYFQLNSGKSSGLGLGLLFDSRTNLLNPKPKEAYISFQAMGFGKILGSDYSFALVDLDMRYYQNLNSKSLMAYQIFGQMRTPDAPYRMLGLLGGPMILRGYYQGRFRDNQMVASQFEYRWRFHKWFGMTAFAAAGNVFNFDFPEQSGGLKSAAGLGLRILVDPKENSFMRFDFALSRQEDFGFYVSFGEAF